MICHVEKHNILGSGLEVLTYQTFMPSCVGWVYNQSFVGVFISKQDEFSQYHL